MFASWQRLAEGFTYIFVFHCFTVEDRGLTVEMDGLGKGTAYTPNHTWLVLQFCAM